jgi:H+-transporting ATPase
VARFIGTDSIISADDARKASVADLMNNLSSNENGLSTSEAGARLQQYGPNEILEKKVNPLIKFLGYFLGLSPG